MYRVSQDLLIAIAPELMKIEINLKFWKNRNLYII